MTATAMAGVIGAPISSALLQLDGAFGLRGWQWLFLIEGLPAILLAPVVLKGLTERPRTPTWLEPAEREWLSNEIAAEQAQTAGAHLTFWAAARSGRLWAISTVYLCIVVAFYGISFWLPQIMQSTSGLGSATIVLLSAIPYMAATAGLVVIGTRSDRTGERRWHLAIPCLIGADGLRPHRAGSPDADQLAHHAVDRGVWHLGHARTALDAGRHRSCAAPRQPAASRS